MSRRRLSRRGFLRGLGVAVALPWLESSANVARLAHASEPGSPRAIFYYVPNGMNMEAWRPLTTGTGFALSETLAPLERHRNQVAVLSGLDNLNGIPTGAGDHAAGTGAFLTCKQVYKTEGSNILNGISVDQRLAQEIGYTTRFPSLQLGGEGGSSVGGCDSGYSCAYSRNISWAGPQTPLPKIDDPQLVFDRLFGGFDPNETEAQRQLRRTRRTSVLDTVLADATDLRGSLGVGDQHKLDEYMTSVRELEQRIAADTELSCLVPSEPGLVLDDLARLELMTELMVLALQCDQTRVVSFMLGNAGSWRSFPWLGIGEAHHDLSHHQMQASNLSALATINRWEIELLASLLDRMAAIDDGPEGTLLDHTTIFFSSEIADGDRHGHQDLPVLLAGGGWRGNHHTDYGGAPIADLFVSLLQHFGLEDTTFGNDGTGPLAGI